VSPESSEEQKFLPIQDIQKKTNEIIQALGIAEWAECGLLNNPQHEMQTPILLRKDSGREGANVSYSYIVPFGLPGEKSKSGVPLTRLCILIDANDGRFQEVTAFVDPVAYLSQEEAVQVVASELGVPVDKLGIVEAESMFRSCEITHVRAYPFWRIVVNGRTYYVDQSKKLYTSLERGKGGS
jgi:hypothetical protein